MRRVITQCVKELRQFIRDRLTVALAFALPALSVLLYGFGTRLEIKNIPLVVKDLDNTLVSRQYIERLFENDQFIAVNWNNRDVVKDAITRGVASGAVVIPPEFERLLKAGRVSPVGAYVDGTDVNNARVIKNSLLATTDFYMNQSGLLSVVQLIKPELRLWFNPGRKESLYVVPGSFGIILWIYPALLGAVAMAREREQGTILQAYASSLTAPELIAGKVAAYTLVGVAEAILVVGMGMIIFDLQIVGDPLLFMLGTLLYVMDSALFGVMIGIGAATQSAAVQTVAFGGFTPALLLSGYLYPVRNIVFPLSLVAYIVPPRYYIELSRDTFVRGAGWAGQWFVPIFLTGMAIFLFRLSIKRLGKMQISA
jgi:ABC-2 type transport system permease protein